MSEKGYLKHKRKLRPGIIFALAVLHILALYGLTRAFAPDLTQSIERNVVETFTVVITAPREEPEVPDEGMQGDPGEEAIPQPVSAPTPRLPPESPREIPQAASTGDANTSGATNDGDGTGASGLGDGTGAGDGGSGRGDGIATGPSVRSGELNQARDFPIPEGGRQSRFGKSVVVHFTVATDGRARNCRVASSSVDADTSARVCPLVFEKIRFNPARRADGTPIEAKYGYRVLFKPS